MLSVKKKKRLVVAIFFIAALAVLSLILFKITYTKVCNDDSCFSLALSACQRAEFMKDTGDARWYYKIKGASAGDQCEIYVKLAQLRRGSMEILKLEGRDMICYLPYSIVESPQKDIERCHGSLREEIQSMLIQKMHSYLLENIGQVSREFTRIV
ncbi:hypothetical protein J4447_00880 [Candidatus Pacearchaeota archaeon]|nr:hypothetical protein [Candidatus Pacearchaeota archaeon]